MMIKKEYQSTMQSLRSSEAKLTQSEYHMKKAIQVIFQINQMVTLQHEPDSKSIPYAIECLKNSHGPAEFSTNQDSTWIPFLK